MTPTSADPLNTDMAHFDSILIAFIFFISKITSCYIVMVHLRIVNWLITLQVIAILTDSEREQHYKQYLDDAILLELYLQPMSFLNQSSKNIRWSWCKIACFNLNQP